MTNQPDIGNGLTKFTEVELMHNKLLKTNFIDARNCIKTDSNYRGCNIIWDKTNENIRDNIKINQLNLTQGFIASDKNNFNVTLGREGSDYSAAIFAFAVNAESLTIWKDVKGLLNGDPKNFKNIEKK